MLRGIVVLAFILHASVAMADEPLEIRSRFFNLQEVEGMVTGTMLVEVTNRRPDTFDNIVVKPKGPVQSLLRGNEIIIDKLHPGFLQTVMLEINASNLAVKSASSIATNWLVEYRLDGQSGKSYSVNVVSSPVIFVDGEEVRR